MFFRDALREKKPNQNTLSLEMALSQSSSTHCMLERESTTALIVDMRRFLNSTMCWRVIICLSSSLHIQAKSRNLNQTY